MRNLRVFALILKSCLLSFWALSLPAQSSNPIALTLCETGRRLYVDGDQMAAEKYARLAIQADPSFTEAHELLAHSLFYQQKYKAAVPEYRRTMEINARTHALPLPRFRAAVDNFAMACGLSGDLPCAKSILRSAIANDRDYPLFYYTLACAYAEGGDLENTIVNLKAAVERIAHVNPGERFPDPRTDPSFAKYRHNPKFQRLIIELGY